MSGAAPVVPVPCLLLFIVSTFLLLPVCHMDEQLEETLAQLRSRQLQLQMLKEDLQRRISAEKRAPRADWCNTAFAWDGQLQDALQSVFGLQQFR